jgi:hypothetical protein
LKLLLEQDCDVVIASRNSKGAEQCHQGCAFCRRAARGELNEVFADRWTDVLGAENITVNHVSTPVVIATKKKGRV